MRLFYFFYLCDGSLLLYRKTDFCILILCPETLLNLLVLIVFTSIIGFFFSFFFFFICSEFCHTLK